MISPRHLQAYVIVPTLAGLNTALPGVLSASAVNLLLGTALHESLGGKFLKQMNGPALGIYQMEPATHDDIWNSHIAYRPDLFHALMRYAPPRYCVNGTPDASLLISDLSYATVMARLKYWFSSFEWPDDKDDVAALAQIWKQHYNTPLGAGTEQQFIDHYVHV